MRISDMNGQFVLQRHLMSTDNVEEVDISNLTARLYAVTVLDKGGRPVSTKVLLKQ
jgi:hypothetical protein